MADILVSGTNCKSYLDDLGCETEDREYKVFTLNPYNLGNSDGFRLLKSGSWTFDSMIESTLKIYIQTYFPKYISTFSHPQTKVRSGSLFIGVDDDGLVHGIPYSGILTEEFIKKQIMVNLDRVRGANDYDCLKKYMDLVKIDIIKLDKTDYETQVKDSGLNIDYNSKMYSQIKANMKLDETKRAEYITKKRKWESFFNSIPQKITDIMNDRKIRAQILDLIKKKSTSTTKLCPKYKNIYGYCDIKNDYWNMLYELKSNKQFEKVTFDSAEKIRNDLLSPIYWGLVWRDLKTSPSKYLKPVPHRVKYNYKQYSILIASQVPKMIPSWIKNNPKMNLYVIKITFSGNISPDLFLEYLDSSNEWTRSYRTTVECEPCCMPIY